MIRVKGGTRAQLDAAAAANQLAEREPYFVSDEDRLAVGTAANGYSAMALEGHTHDIATAIMAGFMSGSMFSKLDGIEAGAIATYTAVGTGGVSRSVISKLGDFTNVVDYGAVADNTTDCSAAFANALAAAVARGHKRVYVPGAATFYRLASTVTTSNSGVTWFGDGPHATKIRTESTGPGFDVAQGLIGVSHQHFMLDRTAGTAGAGKDGIRYSTSTEQAVLRNLYLSHHQLGLNLGGTNYSYAEELLLSDNYSHGVGLASNSTINTLQWTFYKCLAQHNDGYGLYVNTTAGTGQSSVGDISLFSTYANKAGGMAFVGASGKAIQGLRIFGGFVGEDGGSGVTLDTYNSVEHKIEGMFAEIAGVSACGVGASTPATNVGNGMLVTANNGPVTIKNCVIVSNSYSGISMSASRGHIVGCTLRANGLAGVSGERNGIRIFAGETSVVGCTSKGHVNFGVYSDVDGSHVVGNDLRENTSAGYGQTPAIVNSVVMGNAGYSNHSVLGPLQVSGNLTTISGLIGYGAGAGGTVTQATDKSTGVTLNKSSGVITMNNAALANGGVATFTLTNSLIGANDVVLVSAAGFAGPYRVTVGNVAAGSCQISIQNSSGGSLSDALKLNFTVFKVATT